MSVGADDAADSVGDLDEHRVALEMADPVVDALEVVEVEDDHRDVSLVALGARDLAAEELVEEAAVVEARQRVELGQVSRLDVALRVPDRRPGPAGEALERVLRRLGEAGRGFERLIAASEPIVSPSAFSATVSAARGKLRRRLDVVEAVAVDDLERAQVRVVRASAGACARSRPRSAPARVVGAPLAFGRSRSSAASTPGSATTASSVRSRTSAGSSEAASSGTYAVTGRAGRCDAELDRPALLRTTATTAHDREHAGKAAQRCRAQYPIRPSLPLRPQYPQ